MNFDPKHIDPNLVMQVLNVAKYPIGKAQLVQFAKEHGANEQILGLLNGLPDVTFTSAQDVKEKFTTLKTLGNLGGLFKS
ncbi:MAG TPA: DUF2795 domain-containing protein [Ktedonosporobacter sp.]|nr:DUF2795 domain-containing protein [Ktedonosporobacter sp.]